VTYTIMTECVCPTVIASSDNFGFSTLLIILVGLFISLGLCLLSKELNNTKEEIDG